MRRRPTEALRFFLSSSVVLLLVVLLLGTTLECMLRRRWTGCSLVLLVSLLLVSMRSKVELIMLPSLSFLTTRRMTFLTIFFLVGEGGASPAELATAAVGAMVNPKSNTGIYKRWSGVCVCWQCHWDCDSCFFLEQRSWSGANERFDTFPLQ